MGSENSGIGRMDDIGEDGVATPDVANPCVPTPCVATPGVATPGVATPGAKLRVRDRIFEAACELFYRHGIRAVGVDAIAAEAGSNKMSFYRSFASKDALVTEYLREQEREYWIWWDGVVGRYPDDPRRQVEALFEAQLEIALSNNCRGCALGNAAAETSTDEDELNRLVRAYKDQVRKRLHTLAHAMGARNAESLGDALMLLLDGGYFTRLIFPQDSGPISAALPAVRALIDAYLVRAPGLSR
jgi:AcrR family transcriptional regulator